MKCENCGGNLSLEDVVCPHCDALNGHAVQHIRDMKHYKKEFEGTKMEVYSVTKSYTGVVVKSVIITILVILTVICAVIAEEGYSIRRNMIQAEVKSMLTECKHTMNHYLEGRDYYAFAAFCEEMCIYTYDENFEEYASLIYAARHYGYLYDDIMQTLQPYDERISQLDVKRIAEELTQFYRIFDEEEGEYYYIGDVGKNREVALDMQEQIHALLMAYCGLTQEDIKEFPEMSNAQRTLVLEERMLDGE